MYLGQWPRESLRGSQGRAKGWRSGFLEEGEVAVEKQRTVLISLHLASASGLLMTTSCEGQLAHFTDEAAEAQGEGPM